jgi:hypothetical protein
MAPSVAHNVHSRVLRCLINNEMEEMFMVYYPGIFLEALTETMKTDIYG